MSEQARTAESHLAQAADFMQTNGIDAVFVSGTLDDGRDYEGISFMMQPVGELGNVLFADGEALATDAEEAGRRLAVSGFVTEVVRPVMRAAHSVYGEGSDLLDERFDVLGME